MKRLQRLREKLETEVGFKFAKSDDGYWQCSDEKGNQVAVDVTLGKCIEKAGKAVGEE